MNSSCVLPRHASQRGFSLSEMLVAIAVFAFVVLAAYQVFTRSRESYMLGAATADMVQGARVAFEGMNDDIRLAGYEFDVDGIEPSQPNQPDEPLEYMHPRAIVVRGNLDFDKELRGREPRIENEEGGCCPIVTTANDEIVAYYLGKPSGTQPTGTIQFGADITGTNEDPALDDAIRRDAFVGADGLIDGEEWVTIDGVEDRAPTDPGYAPPYTLYRAYIKDNGVAPPGGTNIEKTPLVDNIYSLEFTYYDKNGNEVVGPAAVGVQENWGGTASAVNGDTEPDVGGGRSQRWNIKQIKVKLVTLAPDRDLRLARANPTNIDHFGGKRKYTLEADLRPANLGVRGAKDRDITPPSPPRDIQLCPGECNTMRVSWAPGPPEERVSDHIIQFCNGVCDGTNMQGQVVRFASFDSVNLREYYVLTFEDDNFIFNGNEIGVRVIARNVAGTESECPVSDCSDCCQTESGETKVVGTATRPESLLAALGSGYQLQDTNWPNAKKDNASALQIWTTPTLGPPDNLPHPDYPLAHALSIAMTSPSYTLNVASGAGTPPFNWTTKVLPSTSDESLTCFHEEATPSVIGDDLRTPLANLSSGANVYVFRASGSDSKTWGSASVSDPRNFVPAESNLYALVNLGTNTFDCKYKFDDAGQPPDQDPTNDLWVGPEGTGLTLAYGAPPKAITPGEVYYFRFRVVDMCWKDIAPADGKKDGAPLATAWMRRADFATEAEYRETAMSISPFYPPLMNEGDSAGLRDKPDPGVNDSDAVANNVSPDTYAIPAYALPVKGTGGDYIKPERPSELYLAKVDETRAVLLDDDGTMDGRLVFNASRRNAPTAADWPPSPAAYTQYELWRKLVSAVPAPANEMIFTEAAATRVQQFRTTWAGNGPAEPLLPLQRLTLDRQAEGAPVVPNIGADQPHVYWLRTVQCNQFDDGIDTSTGEKSAASRPFIFPCPFYDEIESVNINPAGGVVHVIPERHDPNGGPLNCGPIAAMRLLAYRQLDSEFVGSTDWVDGGQVPATCQQKTFNATQVTQARRGYAGTVSYAVEMSNDPLDAGRDELDNTTGCRVRSDLLGEGGPAPHGGGGAAPVVNVAACGSTCGTNLAPNFLGTVNDASVTLESSNTVMVVTIPRIGACASQFQLGQLEFALSKPAGTIPTFSSGQIFSGVVGAPMSLPLLGAGSGEEQAFEADLDGSDGTMRLRWHDSFCPGGVCSYPLVDSPATSLVVKLTFAGDMCDVQLTQFNFRVRADFGSGPQQQLCTMRVDDPDPGDRVVAANSGRGPAAAPVVCGPCPLTNCPTCQCPLNDNNDGDIAMDRTPPVSLGIGADAGPNTVLKISYTEDPGGCDSAVCAFEVKEVRVRIECDSAFNCANSIDFIPGNDNTLSPGNRLVHGNFTTVPLGVPTFIDEGDVQYTEYRWQNLSIPITAGETFTIELMYNSPLDIARITALDVRVGGALPSVCGANGEPGMGGTQPSLCRAPVLPIDLN